MFCQDPSWSRWAKDSQCELKFPPSASESQRALTSFQKLLVIKALRPDRLESAMEVFFCKVQCLKTICLSLTHHFFVVNYLLPIC